MRIFLDLSWFFRREWRRYAIAIGALAIVALLIMVPARVAGILVDRMVARTLTSDDLLWFGAGLAALAVVVYGLRVVWRVMLFGASLQLAVELRQRLFAHLTQLSPRFYQRYTTGDLMARTTSDVEAVQMTAGEGVLAMVDGLMTGLIVLTVMCTVISWELTLAALLPWPVMAWYFRRIGQRLHENFQGAQGWFSELTTQAQQNLSGIRTLKAFRLEAQATERFAAAAQQTSKANLAVAATEGFYEPVIVFTIGSSFLLSLSVGSVMIHAGSLSLGELTSFNLYMGFLIWPMFAIGWLLNIVEKGAVAYQRIQALFNESPDITDTGSATPPAQGHLRAAIRRFQFDDATHAALSAVNFDLAPGRMLGLVGPVGSGKSTVLNLILRHYPLGDGEIGYGDRPITDYSLHALRALFAVVPQEPMLFSGTVAENIGLGRPEASLAEIKEAARLAAVDADIGRFPRGFETVVGEKGITLSGGQKQRIAIARALLSGAPVLMLDDVLSAVDVETERQILRHLREARAGTTTIIASHRLSAVAAADEILVLRDGQCLERGNHHALLAQDGWYRQTWHYQQLERLVNEGR